MCVREQEIIFHFNVDFENVIKSYLKNNFVHLKKNYSKSILYKILLFSPYFIKTTQSQFFIKTTHCP